MRYVEQFPDAPQPLERTPKRDARLAQFLQQEIEDAIAARADYDRAIEEALRQYNGIPKNPVRSVPVENAPNIEVTLGAIAVDSLYAQTLSFIFGIAPILTVNPTNAEFEDHAAAAQRFVNWGVANEFELYAAAEHTVFDTVQLGTGVYYIPYLHGEVKAVTRKIAEVGPKILSIPIEDFFLPGGAYHDHQAEAWCGFRRWMTKPEIRDRSKRPKKDEAYNQYRWDTANFRPCGSRDFVRSARERLGHTTTNAKLTDLYEVFFWYGRFDYDRDGIDEDLYVCWDRTSNSIGWCDFTPHDYKPFEVGKYQIRGHVWPGLGVMEMLRPYQEEVTEAHNDRALNVKLANTRMWASRTGQVDEGTLSAWPGRNLQVSNPKEDLVGLQMGEVYPSAAQNESITMALAERRVGVSEAMTPSKVFGSRTPAYTAASALQAQNTRFAPAFENMRRAAAGAVRQCLWRYHEQLMAGDERAEQNIRRVLSPDEAPLLIELLRMDDFETAVAVELTASNASINRDADRQNTMLMTQIIAGYGEKTLQLISIASSPQAPPAVRECAKQLAEAAGNITLRAMRTFDEITDPEQFIIDASAILDKLPTDPTGLLGLAQQMGLPVSGLGGEAPGQGAPQNGVSPTTTAQ